MENLNFDGLEAAPGRLYIWDGDVRFWHLSDMAGLADDVRSRGKSGSLV